MKSCLFACSLLLLLGTSLVHLFSIDISQTAVAGELPKHITVTVEPGETLWHIASRYAKHEVTTWEFIHLIQEENQLDSNQIYPGQTITIPIVSMR
jgi:LysM repeat protein